MKTRIPTILFTALLAAGAGASASQAAVHIECKQTRGKCPSPPQPPSPPAPPAAPSLPAPPAPPAPPSVALPDIPAAAHAACAGKADGSPLTWVIKRGETMTGVCEREDGKMVFQLRSYHLED